MTPSVYGIAAGSVVTETLVRAVRTEVAPRTGCTAVCTSQSAGTPAVAGLVVAVSAIPAGAGLATVLAEGAGRTGTGAVGPCQSWGTEAVTEVWRAGARSVCTGAGRAVLTAPGAEISSRTGHLAGGTSEPPPALTPPGLLTAGGGVTGAGFTAGVPPPACSTQRGAPLSLPAFLALTLSSLSTAPLRIRLDTVAGVGTFQAVFPLRTGVIAGGSSVARSTAALSCHVVTRGSISAVTQLLTVPAEPARSTDLVTKDPSPAWLTVTLARFGVTGSSVLTAALVAAVLAVVPLLAGHGALLPQPARTTRTRPVLRLAVRVVLTSADVPAVLAVSVDRTGTVAVTSGEARLAQTLTSPGVADFRVVWMTLAGKRAVLSIQPLLSPEGAGSLFTPLSLPAMRTLAGSVLRVAGSPIVTGALLQAVLAMGPDGA